MACLCDSTLCGCLRCLQTNSESAPRFWWQEKNQVRVYIIGDTNASHQTWRFIMGSLWNNTGNCLKMLQNYALSKAYLNLYQENIHVEQQKETVIQMSSTHSYHKNISSKNKWATWTTSMMEQQKLHWSKKNKQKNASVKSSVVIGSPGTSVLDLFVAATWPAGRFKVALAVEEAVVFAFALAFALV